jgi:hypothetical protein
MSAVGAEPRLGNGWMPAEAEKERLYNEAQAIAARTQGYATSVHNRTNSTGSRASIARQTSPQPGFPPNQSVYGRTAGSSAYPTPAPSTSPSLPTQSIRAPQPQYPSAEQEKAMRRRYEEARAAVERTQNIDGYDEAGSSAGGSGAASSSDPIPYDALFPSPQTASVSGSASAEMPPVIDGGRSQYTSAVDEKERTRRYYEAQDAVARAQHPYASGAASPPPVVAATISAHTGNSQQPLSEKEMLRRKFEADDAAALRSGPPPQPPPRGAPPPPGSPPRGMTPRGAGAATSGLRSPLPVPGSPLPVPGFQGGFKPLTAAEEKARLKAQYEAEEQQANSSSSSSLPTIQQFSAPPPPPLMPRPPREYIQETQEADARSQQGHYSDVADSSSSSNGPRFDLSMRPFTPFTAGFDSVSSPKRGPPPPLPPKVPAE